MTAPYEPGALPLLAHALLTTWQHREDRLLTVDGYQLTGGIRSAIATTAERAFARLDPAGQNVARKVLLRLVQVGQDAGQTRRRGTMDQLRRLVPDEDLDNVVGAFVGARLLTVDTGTVEITHEALLSAWPRLRDWIEADRTGLHVHQRMTEAADVWQHQGQRQDLLYHGAALAMSAAWADDHAGDLTPMEREFLAASRREQQRGVRRLRRMVALLGVLVLLAMAAGGVAWWQSDQAQRQRDMAVSQKVGTLASGLRATNPALAMQLAVAAHHTADTLEARSAVLTSTTPYVSRFRSGGDWVNAVAFSADGQLLAIGTNDGVAQLWDPSNPRQHRPLGTLPVTGEVCCLAFSPAATIRVLFTASAKGAQLWDVTDPGTAKPLATLDGSDKAIRDATFAPDGHTIVVTHEDYTTRRWNVTDPAHPAELPAEQTSQCADSKPRSVSSPDGRTRAFAQGYQVWPCDADNPKPVKIELGKQITGLAFSPDGTVLATGGVDGNFYMWHAPLAAYLDQRRNPDAVRATSHDHRTIVTGSGRVFLGPANSGQIAATVDNGEEFTLWELDPSHAPRQLARQPVHNLVAVAFHPGGKVLVTGDNSGKAIVWDVSDPTTPHPVTTLDDDFKNVNAVDFSPDGNLMATGDTNHGVRLWDTRNPASPQQIAFHTHHTEAVVGVRFSPDGKFLASTSYDWTIRLWDITDRTSPSATTTITGHTDSVHAVNFSPDGNTLISTGRDRTTRLWNIEDRQHPTPKAVLSHPRPAAAAFASDNRTVVTVADGTVKLWDTDYQTVADKVCDLAGQPISPQEWAQYFEDTVGYQPPCP
ncbi:WD40 repeat protein [Kibdelosporangium banguiense]|uniref:WD40 repeat protein n=1 Tax=Kibdelosporangium banguiense TaxID=1365924 RepID=A0ABS4TRT4_9PSEU|nr:WD40 repeat domain-containing protein [Kibdelosporangium banguiense]MBP2326709.1 WD40 repeat protein [Kibdelosporangium banguiense]